MRHRGTLREEFLSVEPLNHLTKVKQMNFSIWVLSPTMKCKTLKQISRCCYFLSQRLRLFSYQNGNLPEAGSALGLARQPGGGDPDGTGQL